MFHWRSNDISMKSIFLCFELNFICCFRESITCVLLSLSSCSFTLLILLSYLLSPSTFTFRQSSGSSFSSILLFSFTLLSHLIFSSSSSLLLFCLASFPMLGLLDSSLGYPMGDQFNYISHSHKGCYSISSFVSSHCLIVFIVL